MHAPRKSNKTENNPPPGADSAGDKITVRLEFKDLVDKENDLLFEADPTGRENRNQLRTESGGPAGEPWISYTAVDRVGLAFSGGGIRSATFNLGVLKALQDLHVLKYVDYLSTVSGGGYIGAWWTAWRARVGKNRPEEDAKVFPIAQRTDAAGQTVFDKKLNREPEEVRHLREFSNFLSPRMGFFQSETWNAIMAVLSAVLPAVLVASSVITVAFLLWLGGTSVILADAVRSFLHGGSQVASAQIPLSAVDWLRTPSFFEGYVAPALLSILTVLTYIFCERKWHCAQKAERPASQRGMIIFRVIMSICILIGIWLGWRLLAPWKLLNPTPPKDSSLLWHWAVGLHSKGGSFPFSPHLFDAPILWAGVAIVVFLPRLLIMRYMRVSRSGKVVSAIDRALSRLLSAAVIVTVLGVLWLVGCWLKDFGAKVSAGGALLSGGTFALLRNWIGRLGPAKKGGVMDLIKPLIPQILAYIAIALWSVCIAALLALGIEEFGLSPWGLFACALGIILLAMLFFDPAQVSMHSYYRNRLARAYLGASNPAATSAVNNRQTDVRLADDIQLRNLSPDQAKKPLHLVCCAANDLGGDHLANLSRGSRSAVLSKFGFAIGNYCHTWEKEVAEEKESLGLASAITASAAAFNSNMGSLSMTLGGGVTFLCSALNLRLGLWLPHPLTDIDGAPKVWPGLLFLKEMFGITRSGLCPPVNDAPRQPVAKYVHLSDGGHFENLALYELIRRHCRYIIVSDCGADPEVAFDDFGNAVRRIREDFGVEIEIDLSPLKPDATRISKQHVAVGSISYTRGDEKDTGILIYLKPTLTGDEPCDITQYRTRNETFPHESTGDQFYDEAQWESYRRLGEHAARSALRFVERERQGSDLSADQIFNGARWEWYQSRPRQQEEFVAFTGRFTALVTELREKAPKKFVREMFPELQTIAADSSPDTPMISEEMTSVLHFLLQIIQLMEDVWVGCDFETHWNDPNNLGWMNAFQRWAYTPSFRLWWPVVKPLYGSKFRRFIEERLSLADEDYPPTTATVTKHEKAVPDGVAQVYWKRMHERDPNRGKGKTIYSFDLKLTLQRPQDKDTEYEIQAGLAFLDLSRRPTDLSQRRTAHWTNEEFFVPPSLWGAGLGARFLDKLLIELKKEKFDRCEVTVEPPVRTADQKLVFEWLKRTDLASRQQRADLLAFYQRAGFILDADKKLVRNLDDIVVPDGAPASGSGS